VTGRVVLAAVAFVLASTAGGAERAPAGAEGVVSCATGDRDLDALPPILGRTLEVNRKEFAGATGRVLAFGAGAHYPQVWIRDNATVLPLSRYLYPPEYLTSWIEEHLAQQDQTGEVQDWIAAGAPAAFRADSPRVREVGRVRGTVLSADRNSVASDQESSLVLALAEVYRISGDRAWLDRPLRGRSLLDRAQDALNALVRRRLDGETGLIVGGFTADWGDVSPVWPDQRAIYLDAKTPRVGSLYASALFCGAASSLADLLDSSGRRGRAAYWRHHADRVRAAIDGALWQERRGFYRMHAPGPLGDDSDRFALGGNAIALLVGGGGPARLRRVMDVAEKRRRQYGVSTIAGALLPPFPTGFFKHPALREVWTYQNGGQWDWFAGRLLLAAFRGGESRRARACLAEIARKASRNQGLYEWHTREGAGRGSASYAGSAGALAAALFEGLFGVDLAARGLNLTVRLGERSGRIRLREPSTGTWVDYRYDAGGGARRLRLEYESNHPRPGRVALLLPPGRRLVSVRRDGQPVRFERFTVGRDEYVAIETDYRRHALEAACE
jgi:hypothetical protein